MRAFVFLLVFVNLLFFAWSRGLFGQADDAPAVDRQPLHADRIRIVPEEKKAPDGAAALPAAPAAGLAADSGNADAAMAGASAVPKAAPVASASAEVCVLLSGLSQENVEAAEKRLAEALPDFKSARTSATGAASQWVSIAALASRRDADNKAAELRKLGVKEYFIVQDPASSGGFAISLGLFSSRDAATTALAALREKGVRSARITERPGKVQPQLELRGPEAKREDMRLTVSRILPDLRLEACTARDTPP